MCIRSDTIPLTDDGQFCSRLCMLLQVPASMLWLRTQLRKSLKSCSISTRLLPSTSHRPCYLSYWSPQMGPRDRLSRVAVLMMGLRRTCRGVQRGVATSWWLAPWPAKCPPQGRPFTAAARLPSWGTLPPCQLNFLPGKHLNPVN